MKKRLDFTDLDGMLRSEAYERYAGDTLYNLQYHILNPDTFTLSVDDRMMCIDNGVAGVTNEETIENWEDYLDTLTIGKDISQSVFNHIKREIIDCREWHAYHFSLTDVV